VAKGAQTEPKTKGIRVNVTPEMRDRMEKLSKETDLSIAWHARRAIEEYLEKEER
jgi:predicted DNA-binding protein